VHRASAAASRSRIAHAISHCLIAPHCTRMCLTNRSGLTRAARTKRLLVAARRDAQLLHREISLQTSLRCIIRAPLYTATSLAAAASCRLHKYLFFTATRSDASANIVTAARISALHRTALHAKYRLPRLAHAIWVIGQESGGK